MNIKKFFKIFGVTTLILCLVLVVVLVSQVFIFSDNLGQKIDTLSEYKQGSDDRRNVLLLGTDKSGLRSDVMMVFSFSTKDHSINSVSIPRDTKVTLYGKTYKINSALQIGKEELAIQAVKDVTGIPIHDCVKVNFDAVSDVVDALDGVEFDVPQRMYYEDPYQDLLIDLQPGVQLLDGEHAVQLLRFRQYPMADLQRVKVQQEFMKAAFDQKFKLKYVFKTGEILEAIEENITSSLSIAEATKLAKQVFASGVNNINSLELPTYLSSGYVIVDNSKIDAFVEENFK